MGFWTLDTKHGYLHKKSANFMHVCYAISPRIFIVIAKKALTFLLRVVAGNSGYSFEEGFVCKNWQSSIAANFAYWLWNTTPFEKRGRSLNWWDEGKARSSNKGSLLVQDTLEGSWAYPFKQDQNVCLLKLQKNLRFIALRYQNRTFGS